MNANRMGALKFPTGLNSSLFFCLHFQFILSLRQLALVDSEKVSDRKQDMTVMQKYLVEFCS